MLDFLPHSSSFLTHNIIMTFEDFQYNFSAQPRSHQVNLLVRDQTANNWLVRLDANSFDGLFVVGVALLLTRVEFILSTVKKIIVLSMFRYVQQTWWKI